MSARVTSNSTSKDDSKPNSRVENNGDTILPIEEEIFDLILDEITMETGFEMHKKLKLGFLTQNSESIYSDVVVRAGHDIFGQHIDGSVADTKFECPNCKRTVVASRYAPHLEKCMGIGRNSRNSSRIAKQRMTADALLYNGSFSDTERKRKRNHSGKSGSHNHSTHNNHAKTSSSSHDFSEDDDEEKDGTFQVSRTAATDDFTSSSGEGKGGSSAARKKVRSGSHSGSHHHHNSHKSREGKSKSSSSRSKRKKREETVEDDVVDVEEVDVMEVKRSKKK